MFRLVLTRTVGSDNSCKVLQGADHMMAPVGLEVVHFDRFQHGWHFSNSLLIERFT